MRTALTIPPRHPVVRRAAEAVGSDCAVLLVGNSKQDTFDVYLYGKTDGQCLLAEAVADVALKALETNDPPEGLEQALKLIASAPKGQA